MSLARSGQPTQSYPAATYLSGLSANRHVSSRRRRGKARNRRRMVLRVKVQTKVENPRGYIAKVVDELRNLLTAGARARRDPSREGKGQKCHGLTSLWDG